MYGQATQIQYNTTSFISNIEHNYIITTIFTQHWDGWKGGGPKNNLIVVHPPTFNIHCQCKIKNERNKVQIILIYFI